MEFTVTEQQWVKERLDHFLQHQLVDMSRTRLQSLIKDEHILLNGSPTKAKAMLKLHDVVTVVVPEAEPTEILAQDIPLNVLFEDEHIIVINKPEGLVVHPAAGNPDGTLVNALLFHCKNLSGIGGELRPGIVHRLDKETSGCLVAAKHDLAHNRLTDPLTPHLRTTLRATPARPPQKQFPISRATSVDRQNTNEFAIHIPCVIPQFSTALAHILNHLPMLSDLSRHSDNFSVCLIMHYVE